MHITLRRLAAPVVLAAGAIALGTTTASAHVDVTPSTTAAGEYALLSFAVGHGCDGSATTKVAIDIPEGIDVVTPTINDGWTIQKETEPLEGGEEDDRVSRVTYTAKKPLPDGFRDAFELSAPLPTEPGTTLRFPTLQTCVKGQTDWSEVPKDGQTEDDLDAPAPSMTLTEPGSDSVEEAARSTDTQPAAEADSTEGAQAGDTSSDDSSDALAWTALGVGAVGVLVGGVALGRSRTRA